MPLSTSTCRYLWLTTKPTITASNSLMAVCGVVSAWRPGALAEATAAIAGTTLAVAAANTFNMAYEHRRDASMERTRARPIAAGHLCPGTAWRFGILLATAATALLATTTPAATVVGLLAIVSYAFVYTPLKSRTPYALFVGALPGATPPLIGAVAMGASGLGSGLSLFVLLLLWQLPHFLAIATRRADDYRRAGLRPFPVVHGEHLTRTIARTTALAIVPASILPYISGAMSLPATLTLAGLGLLFAFSSLRESWVAPTFVTSLVYLPLLTALILVDRAIGYF